MDKYCPDCGHDKPMEDFYNNSHQKDGKSTYCKEHLKERNLEREREKALRPSKICSTCKNEKPQTSYYRLGNGASHNQCNECRGSRTSSARKTRAKDEGHESLSSYFRTKDYYWAQRSLGAARARKKWEVLIDSNHLRGIYEATGGICPVSGKEMKIRKGYGWDNVSIDRIDSSIGYVEGNVRLVCWWVNMAKSTMTDSELIDWCRTILRHNGELPP